VDCWEYHIAVPQLKWSPQRGRQAWAQATTGSLHSRPSPSFYRSPSTHPRPPHFCPVRGKRTVARLLRSDHFTACTPAFTLHLLRRSSTSLTRSQHPRSSGLLCDRSIHGVHALKAFRIFPTMFHISSPFSIRPIIPQPVSLKQRQLSVVMDPVTAGRLNRRHRPANR